MALPVPPALLAQPPWRCPHLLSHPTLGLRGTPSSSSSVRVARQGTELSSGLRAGAGQAGHGSGSKEQQESKGEKLKEKKRKKIMAERKAQAVVQGSQAGQKVGTVQRSHQSPLI